MSKSIQLKNENNEKFYPHPYYPVGSIYLSVNDTNPSVWFGGTWEQIAKGRTLVGVDTNDTDFNTVKKTGGSKSQELKALIGNIDGNTGRMAYVPTGAVNGQSNYNSYAYQGLNHFFTGGCGYNHATPVKRQNNTDATTVQPYFTCYIWCRTA
jgi:hypothetical protein